MECDDHCSGETACQGLIKSHVPKEPYTLGSVTVRNREIEYRVTMVFG